MKSRYFKSQTNSSSFGITKSFAALIIIFLFITTAIVHFKLTAFFYWDEWDVLDKFRLQGAWAVFDNHGVHLIPVYLCFYYLETLIFSNNYLFFELTSVLLHTLNAFLFCKLLLKLTKNINIALVGAWFFCSCFLATTAISLAILQSLELALLFLLIGIHQSINFIDQGKAKFFYFSLLAAILSALSFAGSMVSSFTILICSTLYFLILVVEGGHKITPYFPFGKKYIRNELRVRYKRTLILFAQPLAYFSIMVLVYLLNHYYSKESIFLHSDTHHSIPVFFSNLGQIAKFFALGTQYGGFWRATGLIVDIKFDSNVVSSLGYLDIKGYVGLFVLVLFGLIVNITCLAISLRDRLNRVRNFIIWSLGQLIILMYFILPAVGRWTLSPVQSLEPRYQLIPLIGISMIFALALDTALDKLDEFKISSFNISLLLPLFLGLFFLNQQRLSLYYRLRPEYENVTQSIKEHSSLVMENKVKYGLGDTNLGKGVDMNLFPQRYTPTLVYQILEYLERK